MMNAGRRALARNEPADGLADVVAENDMLAAVEAPLAAVHDGEVALSTADLPIHSSGQLLAAVEHADAQKVRHGFTPNAKELLRCPPTATDITRTS